MMVRKVLQKIWRRFLSLSLKAKAAVVVIVVLLFGIISSFLGASKKNNGYVVEPVKKTSVREIVSDSGKIVSGGNVDVNSPTKGFIEELFIQNGQIVKEGDKLFTVKSSATAQEQQTAYSAYLAAVSTLKASQSLAHSLRSTMFTDWETFVNLATSDTYEKSDGTPIDTNRAIPEFHTAKEDWLAAEQKVIDQDKAIAANQAAVTAAWTAYQATQTTTVTAQVPGTVANLSVSTGNSVGVPSVLTPSVAPVLTLVSEAIPEAVLLVGQTNIAKVKIGQKVIIHPDPYKDKDFEGSVVRVDSLGHNVAGVVTYNVYVQITNADSLLKPEMTVDGDIVTAEKEDVLAVPNSAVVLYQGGKAVRVKKGKDMDYLSVQIGLKGETMTEIVSGLNEGQEIISALTNEKVKRPSMFGI
jgi:HlyD family secretion protein